MSYPWEGTAPPASFEFGLADHVGSLAFFVIGGLERDVSTSFGDRDAIRCSLVLLDGPEGGKEFEDILLFNSRIVSRFRNVAGTIRLHRITYAEAKGGNNKPVEIVDATEADNQLAASWYSYYPNRLHQMLDAVTASWKHNQAKAQQGQRVRSEPHPTHAGSRTPANNWNQGQQQQQQAAPPPGWSQQAAQNMPPANPQYAQQYAQQPVQQQPVQQYQPPQNGQPGTAPYPGYQPPAEPAPVQGPPPAQPQPQPQNVPPWNATMASMSRPEGYVDQQPGTGWQPPGSEPPF